ncbi:MAG: hypothetical protein Kow0069_15920 [Promethearchaeota archaeon]
MKRWNWWFTALYVTSRVLIALIPGWMKDLQIMGVGGSFWQQSALPIPYDLLGDSSQGILTNRYPPVLMVYAGLIVWLFGSSPLGIKLAYCLTDAGVAIATYKLAKAVPISGEDVKSKEKRARVALVLYAFSPVSVLTTFGFPEALPLLFLVTGAWAYYKERLVVAGALLALGFLSEVFPAFVLAPLTAYCAARRKWRALAKMAAGFLAASFFTCLPFLLVSVEKFSQSFLVHFSRYPEVFTIWRFLEPRIRWELFSAFGLFNVSPVGLTFLLTLGVFSVASFFLFKRHEDLGPEVVILAAVATYLLVPLAFMAPHFKYYYWSLPLACAVTTTRSPARRLFALGAASTALLVPLLAYSKLAFSGLNTLDVHLLDEETVNHWLSVFFFAFEAYSLVTVAIWQQYDGRLAMAPEVRFRVSPVQFLHLTQLGFVLMYLLYGLVQSVPLVFATFCFVAYATVAEIFAVMKVSTGQPVEGGVVVEGVDGFRLKGFERVDGFDVEA